MVARFFIATKRLKKHKINFVCISFVTFAVLCG
jgi:hypothetical protein